MENFEFGISIVICTFNGKARLETTLEHAKNQKTEFPFEILIVDNASNDGSGKWIDDYLMRETADRKIRQIYEPSSGLSHARIRGMKEALYPLVLFCDDDNWLQVDYIQKACEILVANPKIGVLGGYGIASFEGSKPDWFDSYAHSFAVGPQSADLKDSNKLSHVYGAGAIFRKEPISNLLASGFAPVLLDRINSTLSSGGDVEWCWLMRLLGYSIHYSGDLKFYHQLPESRLTWEYYLNLKKGISGSAGLLYTYSFFFKNRIKSTVWFRFIYFREELRSRLLYLKYLIIWSGNPQRAEDQVSFAILKSHMKSFSEHRNIANIHLTVLKKYFGN